MALDASARRYRARGRHRALMTPARLSSRARDAHSVVCFWLVVRASARALTFAHHSSHERACMATTSGHTSGRSVNNSVAAINDSASGCGLARRAQLRAAQCTVRARARSNAAARNRPQRTKAHNCCLYVRVRTISKHRQQQ